MGEPSEPSGVPGGGTAGLRAPCGVGTPVMEPGHLAPAGRARHRQRYVLRSGHGGRERRPSPPGRRDGSRPVIAGVAGGTVSILAGSIYGIVVGIALAMPVFFQYGYGVGTVPLGPYPEARDRRALAVDAAGTAVAGAVAGTVVATAGAVVSLPLGLAMGMAVGATFLGGGAVFLARTSEFQDGE